MASQGSVVLDLLINGSGDWVNVDIGHLLREYWGNREGSLPNISVVTEQGGFVIFVVSEMVNIFYWLLCEPQCDLASIPNVCNMNCVYRQPKSV